MRLQDLVSTPTKKFNEDEFLQSKWLAQMENLDLATSHIQTSPPHTPSATTTLTVLGPDGFAAGEN